MRNLLAFAMLVAVCPAHGYIRQYFRVGNTITPLRRADNAGIQYYLNALVVTGASSSATGSAVQVVSPSSDPVAAARAALATWNRLGADIKFLPLKSTTALHDRNDGKAVITFAANSYDLSILGYASPQSTGAIAVTDNTWYTSGGLAPDGTTVVAGSIADSDILLNPALTFSTDGSTPYDMQAVLTHELGHALGADHTGVIGAAMFQSAAAFLNGVGKANLNQRVLSSDEAAFAAAVYPLPGTAPGTLTGKVSAADGSAVQHGLITVADTSSGVMTGTITGADGTYSVQVPAGTYVVYAEPLNGIVGRSNIVSFIQDPPAVVTTAFQPTFAGSLASPAKITVAGGATASADITVAPPVAGISSPLVAFGTAGGAGDITSAAPVLGPKIIPSGQSFDVGVLGGGFDTTMTVQVVGPGISVRAGSIRQDPRVNFLAGPLVRATIDVQARATPALASILFIKGSAVVAQTGTLVLVPPTPTFTSKGVVSSASGLGLNGDGVVTPGGLVTIYDIPGTPNLGPAAFVQPAQFDDYGKLPTVLGGVTVTFDGTPAPVFLAWNQQLNVQVPFEVAGRKSTVVQVDYFGSTSAPATVPVAASQPALFTYPGGAIAGNQDYSLNTATNAASRGSVISLYGTGLGKTSADLQTGVGAPVPPPGYTGGGSCTLGGGKNVSVAFTGWTPSAVGLAQWSFVIPADSPTGTVSVQCSDSTGAATQAGTIYIK